MRKVIRKGPIIICGQCASMGAEKMADTKWDKLHLRWHVAMGLPGVLLDAFRAEAETSFNLWADVCGLTFSQVQTKRSADVILTTGPIDGPGGTLAWSNLPPTNPVYQKYDTGERWNRSINLQAVLVHEIGHAIGLYHGRSGIMRPHYDPKVKTPQPADIKRVQALYGPPQPKPEPPKPEPPRGEGITIFIPGGVLVA